MDPINDASPPTLLPVLAALANSACLRRFAEVVAGADDAYLPKVDDILLGAGLFVRTPSGGVTANPAVFRELLAQARPREQATEGLERFLRDGRLQAYPKNSVERVELLRLLAAGVRGLASGLRERELNEALAGVTDDVARLRRAMVDEGVLVRTADGSSYRTSS